MEENLKTDGAKFALHAAIVGYFSVEPSDLSLLHLLFYISSAGGLEELEASSTRPVAQWSSTPTTALSSAAESSSPSPPN